jgi:hypothetical protein
LRERSLEGQITQSRFDLDSHTAFHDWVGSEGGSEHQEFVTQ